MYKHNEYMNTLVRDFTLNIFQEFDILETRPKFKRHRFWKCKYHTAHQNVQKVETPKNAIKSARNFFYLRNRLRAFSKPDPDSGKGGCNEAKIN